MIEYIVTLHAKLQSAHSVSRESKVLCKDQVCIVDSRTEEFVPADIPKTSQCLCSEACLLEEGALIVDKGTQVAMNDWCNLVGTSGQA